MLLAQTLCCHMSGIIQFCVNTPNTQHEQQILPSLFIFFAVVSYPSVFLNFKPQLKNAWPSVVKIIRGTCQTAKKTSCLPPYLNSSPQVERHSITVCRNFGQSASLLKLQMRIHLNSEK